MPAESKCCAICCARDHALGGRGKSGAFRLALPIATAGGRTTWPRLGTHGWCGEADGEIERLTIIRIALTRSTVNGAPALLCQQCRSAHDAAQGIFTDLFAASAP